MLATGRYAQWRSRFLRYIDTRPNGDALRKCILIGPYTPTIVTTPAVPATEDSPLVPEQTKQLKNGGKPSKGYNKVNTLNIQDVIVTTYFGSLVNSPLTMEKQLSLTTQDIYKMMNEMIRNNLTVATMQGLCSIYQTLHSRIWSRFVSIVKQQHKLDDVSYHKLFDILDNPKGSSLNSVLK
ncbi:hypothetical protein Tco_0672252 [Tanacetum coccineum]